MQTDVVSGRWTQVEARDARGRIRVDVVLQYGVRVGGVV